MASQPDNNTTLNKDDNDNISSLYNNKEILNINLINNLENFDDDLNTLENLNFIYIKAYSNEKRPKSKNWPSIKKSQIINKDKDRVGYITGKISNVTLLDVDFKDNGVIFFKNFCKKNNIDWENYIYYITPSGGIHIPFKYDERLNTKSKCYDENHNLIGIDVRNDGGFAMCPPSINYDWVNHPDDFEYDLEEMPECLVQFILKSKKNILNNKIMEENIIEPIINNKQYENSNKIKDLINIINKKYSDNRDDWIKIGICIKNIVENKDEAFDIWNDFSNLSKKYKASEINKEWNSLKIHESTSIGILINYAKENKKKLKDWYKLYPKLEDKKENIIKEIPILNKFDLNDDFDFTDLKDYLFNNIFKNENELIEYLQNNLYKTCVRVNDYMITKQPKDEFNNIHSIEKFDCKWRTECKTKYWYFCEIDGCDKVKQIPIKDFLELYPYLINCFKKINTEFILKDQILNNHEFYITEEFKCTYIDNLSKTQESKIYPLLDMIKEVYCKNDENLFDLIIKLFAFWITNPNEKSGKCLILAGSQGTGKTTIIEFFSEFIFGNKICMFLTGFKQLLSDKNGHLSGKKFVNINEAKSKKGDYFTNFDDLKTLISDKIIAIRGMYKDTINQKSSMELIVTTNNPNCAPIEDNDRKYIVLNVNDKYLQKDSEYWGPLREKTFNQECGNILYTYLLNLNITPTVWRQTDFKSLDTELKKDLNMLNKSTVELFILDLQDQLKYYDGKKSLTYSIFKDGDKQDINYIMKIIKDKVRISGNSLYEAYNIYCKNSNENPQKLKYFGFELKNKMKLEFIKSNGIMWYIF